MERWGFMSTYYRQHGDLLIEPATAGEVASTPPEVFVVSEPDPDPILVNPSGESSPAEPDIRSVGIEENEDPTRTRIRNPASRKKWAKIARYFLRLIKRYIFRQLTNEEKAMEEDIKKRKIQEKQLIQEAKVAERRMVNKMTKLGICHVKKNGKGNISEIQKVRFCKVFVEPNALWFKVDLENPPYGFGLTQLSDPDLVSNLSVSVGHKVMARWNEESGLWYVVERASGMMGIPNHVNLTDMWERIPDSRNALTIPVGLTNNSRAVYESLDDMVHLMIAGTTGGGKSNFLNVILCTLIRRNSPARLELLLVDLKLGLEFNYYEGIPHLRKIPIIAPTGVIYERDDVENLLHWVIKEGEKRMSILREAGCKNIGEYNQHRRKNAMKHMVLVVDEWADVKLGKNGKETEDQLANAVQRMRAVGIHCIICTQTPMREVLGTRIKANIPAKFAFSCSSMHGSMAILDSAIAAGLQPVGRCIFSFQKQIQVQTPFMPKELILETVRGAISGKYENSCKKHDVSPEEVREWAIRENNGWLAVQATFNKFKGRGLTKDELISWLQDWEEQEFLVGSSTYKVAINQGASHGRRMVVVNDEPPETPQP
jgi:DNA segregation ATPase FtsK/SpoIIIE-like protein